MAEKPNVLKDFRSLPRALAAAAQTNTPATKRVAVSVGAKHGFSPPKSSSAVNLIGSMNVALDPDDYTDVAITKVLADGRERSPVEVRHALAGLGVSDNEVLCTLKRMAIDGILNCRFLGDHAGYVYSQKTGISRPTTNNKQQKVRMAKENNLEGADPRGTIIAAEGIDVAIWKATCDRKLRNIDEIGEILAQYGFNRGAVKDRVIYLANKGWYDRQGRAKQTRYSLKKHIVMPEADNREVHNESAKVNSTTTIHTRDEKFTPPTPTLPVTKAAPVAVVPKAEVVNMTDGVDLVLRKEDGMILCIWKTMADYRPYTPTEVGLLLADFGFNPKSVGARMNTLTHRGWFDREQQPGQSRQWFYTLRRDVPPPPPEDAGKAAKVVASTQATLPLATTPEPVKVEEPKPTVVEAKPVAAPVQNAPLFEFTVKLKGVEMSHEEANTLAAELVESGFGSIQNTTESSSSLIDFQIRIKGVAYTKEELGTITKALVAAGYGK